MPTSASAHSTSSKGSHPRKGSERRNVISVGRPSRMARFSRYYQSQVPVCNRFLALKWEDRKYSSHRRELGTTKAKIDNSPPLTYVHLQLNLKKLENEEFRLCDMENENRVLLEKMSYIFRTPPAVDTVRNTKYDILRSVGKVRMQREFIRITAENHAILKRILTQQPKYATKKFLLEFKWHQKIMTLNAKYPILWDHNQMPQYTPPEVPDTRYLQTLLTPLRKRRDYRPTRPGEKAVDRFGFPFPEVGQRLKQPMQRFWRRKSSSPGTSLGDGGSRKSVTPWTAVDSRPSAGGPRSSVGGPRSSVGGPRSSVGGSRSSVGGPPSSVGGDGGSRTDAKKSGVSEASGLAAVPEAAEEESVSRSASDIDEEEHGGTTPDPNADTKSPAADETTPDKPQSMESVGDYEDDEDDDEVDDEDEKDEDEEEAPTAAEDDV
ncbi:hypothetical protein LSAT2_006939 [Lamellibrachia satsuma]|nr:hypothetical protein LSAT2_006939 [Lamellibrachia satsuma]